MGTRSQSERIRTYNFSQDRVTDHRTGYSTRDIKVTTLHKQLKFTPDNFHCVLFFLKCALVQEFMRRGEPLDLLISDVETHAEMEALLEVVERSSSSSGPSARTDSHTVKGTDEM